MGKKGRLEVKSHAQRTEQPGTWQPASGPFLRTFSGNALPCLLHRWAEVSLCRLWIVDSSTNDLIYPTVSVQIRLGDPT